MRLVKWYPRPVKAGRKRSEVSRRAILTAALEITRREGYRAVTMERIAAEAGVGKQTLYRWWSSRAEVVLEALGDLAESNIPVLERGSLRLRLSRFFVDSFRSLRHGGTAELLRGLMAEAQLDPAFRAELKSRFIDRRRAALRSLLESSKVAPGKRELLIDLGFGYLWYRLLLGYAPGKTDAESLASALAAAAGDT